ncbi:MAG: MBL fold metallo-hydrolase [Dehalococcoidia bacterium]|nr:MBL fold metallo-hydrolase [Dehalococcoidia bacterium]
MPVSIIKVGPLGPYDNNAYVIIDGATRQSIFVDAPLDSGRAIDAAKGTDVRRIIITHRHGDHWGNIDQVKAATGAPAYCHEDDRAPYAAKVDGTVADREDVRFGESIVRVVHTPGHTPGSICLFVETADGPALIAGDTLFPGGPGRSDSAASLRQMVSSIKARLLPLPDETVVYPGHGDNTTIGDARREVAGFDAREHPADLHGDVTWAG